MYSSLTLYMNEAPFSNISNSTAYTSDNGPVYIGFIAAAIAVFFFGTAFLPLKKYEASDGLFYQWILANGIIITGIIVNIVQGAPKFYPLTMVGGAIWAAGNVCVVVIIKTIGMGVGFCLWNVSNILAGWATGRFGLFHTDKRVPSNEIMNYAGVTIAVISAAVFTFVKPRPPTPELTLTVTDDIEREPLINNASLTDTTESQRRPSRQSQLQTGDINGDCHHKLFYETMSPFMQRLIGVGLSLISGLMYGFSFLPSLYIQDNFEGASQDGLDYVLAQFLGIYSMSVVMLVIYIMFSRNRPVVNNRLILPGLIAGIMWGIACSAWFIANKKLSQTISFPIVCSGPTIVCNLFTVFLFREITQKKDLIILVFGLCLTVMAVVLTGLSI